MATEVFRSSIQCPVDMKDALEPYAHSQGRSLSAEIIYRTRQSMLADPAFKQWAAAEAKKLTAATKARKKK